VREAIIDDGDAGSPGIDYDEDSDSDFQPHDTRKKRRGPTLRRSSRGRQKHSGPTPSTSVAPELKQPNLFTHIASKRPARFAPPSTESLKRLRRKNGRLIGEFPCPGCTKCDRLATRKTFTRESDLARHLEKARYVCSRCQESVSRLDALRRHERTCFKQKAEL
jgi:uncharacterized Zn-finger protein